MFRSASGTAFVVLHTQTSSTLVVISEVRVAALDGVVVFTVVVIFAIAGVLFTILTLALLFAGGLVHDEQVIDIHTIGRCVLLQPLDDLLMGFVRRFHGFLIRFRFIGDFLGYFHLKSLH